MMLKTGMRVNLFSSWFVGNPPVGLKAGLLSLFMTNIRSLMLLMEICL